MKKKVLVIIVVFTLLVIEFGAVASDKSNKKDKFEPLTENGTEYWALLVGCNEFLNKPAHDVKLKF